MNESSHRLLSLTQTTHGSLHDGLYCNPLEMGYQERAETLRAFTVLHGHIRICAGAFGNKKMIAHLEHEWWRVRNHILNSKVLYMNLRVHLIEVCVVAILKLQGEPGCGQLVGQIFSMEKCLRWVDGMHAFVIVSTFVEDKLVISPATAPPYHIVHEDIAYTRTACSRTR